MREIGQVKSVTDGVAVVQVIRKGACGENCTMCGLCAANTVQVNAQCDIPVTVGERVWLQSSTGYVLFGLAVLFVFPILFPLITYLLASAIFGHITALAAAILMEGGCIVGILFLSKSPRYLRRSSPRVVAKQSKGT